MTRRGLAALGAVVAVGLGGFPAHAAPYAGQHRYADSLQVAVHGADGATWQVQVAVRVAGAFQSEPDTPLLITVSRCTGTVCAPIGRWRQQLLNGRAEVPDDLSSGMVDTVVMGLPLRLTLTSTTALINANSVQFGYEPNDPTRVDPRADYGKSAAGTLTIGKLTCKVKAGQLGTAVARADTNGPNGDNRIAPPSTWPLGMLGARASC
jgi:hypothetical protein